MLLPVCNFANFKLVLWICSYFCNISANILAPYNILALVFKWKQDILNRWIILESFSDSKNFDFVFRNRQINGLTGFIQLIFTLFKNGAYLWVSDHFTVRKGRQNNICYNHLTIFFLKIKSSLSYSKCW